MNHDRIQWRRWLGVWVLSTLICNAHSTWAAKAEKPCADAYTKIINENARQPVNAYRRPNARGIEKYGQFLGKTFEDAHVINAQNFWEHFERTIPDEGLIQSLVEILNVPLR